MNRTGKNVKHTKNLLVLLMISGLTLTGCSAGGKPAPNTNPTAPQSSLSSESTPEPSNSPSLTPTVSNAPSENASPTPTASEGVSKAQKLLATLSSQEKIGQILMAGIPATGATAQDRANISENSLGNVFLKGRSTAGVAETKNVVDHVKKTISAGQSVEIEAWVSTDQEGGLVQVLKGNGFSRIPSGKTQGTWSTQRLEQSATQWAQELAKAGINVNLAPVADTVPGAGFAPSNAPIGYFGREYGFTPSAVSDSTRAFSQGMKEAGVAPVVKHFPGLGRVTKNTDVAKNVTDTKTTRNDPYLEPFKDAIADGNHWVMVSNAYYSKIDPKNIAPFSSTIMQGMLREDLGFTGLIITDDVCDATQLSPWSLATRATRFFEAGGTVLLCVESSKTAVMAKALNTKVTQDPAFAALIDAAALKVLETKLD